MAMPRAITAPESLKAISASTIGHYAQAAEVYRNATWEHDVSQNIEALLEALPGSPPHRILDLGCGPGRDLVAFRDLGQEAIGLDGCAEFVDMARAASRCEVWEQDMLDLDLPAGHFDGVYANAVLFHVPSEALPDVLGRLHAALRTDGILFTSNPRGENEEGWVDERYACFYSLETWRRLVAMSGFELIRHYFRPPGRPRRQQPWLATLWRRI